MAVSTDLIRTLHDREWVREVGRREVPGRPVLYGTTRQFLEHFNLKTLEDMPPLSELRPIEEIGAELDRRLAQNPGDVSRPPAGEDSGSLSAEPVAIEAASPQRGG
ncbi:MAG: hypothetical protein A2140_09555 [Candidatus Muproteobacteria bacterium RBG_16_62_13]|uniref:SMC-Scp complex subunit ScpB n=1 Tax=Candidatus Muproteobacteria bacterium RBG_16_62_13 TaxID=1817756 RepID=A0A1F6T024_9PROT|nr:MAG: hypothetical protein A2140_09555 [Candidatus Muproteobacteria bacterium RBG_16_62_13]